MYFKKLFIVGSICMMMPCTVFGKEIEATIYSKGAVLIEQDSKRILYDKACDEPLPMASTTKIMTCLYALEYGNLDDVVEVSDRASVAPPVKLKLQAGEKQWLGDLLYSLMLESHNDTAVAIAEHLEGSVENFCVEMTNHAKELGAVNTSFATPNGLDAIDHYATPYDLAVIMSHALQNEQFIKIISTPDITIPTEPLEGSRRHDLQNKNRFLTSYEGAIGGKTGYTSKAGHCFVGAAQKDEMQLIGVALGAGWGDSGKTRKYSDVIKMMNHGFKNYKKYNVLQDQDDQCTIAVDKGKEELLTTYTKEEIILPLTEEEKKAIKLKATVPNVIEAPVQKDQVIGKLDIVCNDQVIKSCELIAEKTIEKATAFELFKRYIKDKLE